MAEKLGGVSLEETQQSVPGMPGLPPQHEYSEQTAREIDCAVRDLVNDAFNRAQDILQRERAVLEEGARQLLAKETLSEADLKALFAPLAAAQTQA